MNNFLKVNKNLITYSLTLFLIIPIFGVKLFMSVLGNIMILLFLIPLLLLIILLIGFNSLKTKINTCNSCGTLSFGLNDTCLNCGAELRYESQKIQLDKKPSERTIEINAEEIK